MEAIVKRLEPPLGTWSPEGFEQSLAELSPSSERPRRVH
jgi:hypothetical protein